LIADTTFLSDLLHGQGNATAFLAAHRTQQIRITVISAGEIAVIFRSTRDARAYLQRYRILRLLPEIAYTASEIEREQIWIGGRLGENDNWIAGFCRYYGEPVISNDAAFDRVRGLRRLAY
jgi:predicted nucleic acid-binding protein